jgi:hypothetical protein
MTEESMTLAELLQKSGARDFEATRNPQKGEQDSDPSWRRTSPSGATETAAVLRKSNV